MGEAFRDRPAEVFRHAWNQLLPNIGLAFGPRSVFGPVGPCLSGVLGVADVTGSDGLFELSRRRPSNASRHWIIAVRDGRSEATEAPTGLLDPAWRSEFPLEALFGPDVIDLVACSHDLRRVVARLTGTAPVLGQPQEPGRTDKPVRVVATPWQWLMHAGRAVLPVGTEEETRHYLLNCGHGVVANDVAHGEALLRKMARQLPAIPPVLVANHTEEDDDDE